jgi:hypothetical protein
VLTPCFRLGGRAETLKQGVNTPRSPEEDSGPAEITMIIRELSLRRRMSACLSFGLGGLTVTLLWLTGCSREKRTAPAPGAPTQNLTAPRVTKAADDIPPYALVPLPPDDSGVFSIYELFTPPLKDPLSLKNIRDAFYRAGYRGAERIETDLTQGRIPARLVPKNYVRMATFYLFEGDFEKASAALQKARSMLEKDPASSAADLDLSSAFRGLPPCARVKPKTASTAPAFPAVSSRFNRRLSIRKKRAQPRPSSSLPSYSNAIPTTWNPAGY